MKDKKLKKFYEEHTWGANTIKKGKDMPNMKLEYLLDSIPDNENVSILEIGCGSGRILSSIRERKRKVKLTGIDISKTQISLAKKINLGHSIDFFVGDAEKILFPDNTFSHVIIMDVLEHVEVPQKMLDEARRVLKKGGILLSFIPVEDQGIYWLSKKIFRRHFKAKSGGHIQQFTFKQIDSMAKRSGFEIKERNYSYHLLGSMMDYSLYTLLLWKRFAKLFWSKNKYYQQKNASQKPTLLSKALNMILTLGNAIAYYESKILHKTKFMATGIQIVAKKK